MNARHKFLIGSGIIIATLLALAYVGFTQSKTYYHTIAELETLKGTEAAHRMRIGGTVQPGSIHHVTGRTDFVLLGEGKSLPVSYIGTEVLPDSFIDNSQALIEGTLGRDGKWQAAPREMGRLFLLPRMLASSIRLPLEWLATCLEC